MISSFKRAENIAGGGGEGQKVENAGYLYLFLFPQSFQMASWGPAWLSRKVFDS